MRVIHLTESRWIWPKLVYKLSTKVFISLTLRRTLMGEYDPKLILKLGKNNFSALKKSYFLKSMLLPNLAFNVIYTGNKKKNYNILTMFK